MTKQIKTSDTKDINEHSIQAISALISLSVRMSNQFKPQDVVNLTWALATLGEEPGGKLLSAMSRRVAATAGEFKPQALANLMRALAALNVCMYVCMY